MNWEDAKIIHKNKEVSQRRVVEGALINICNSLEGNKSFTQEDRQTDKLICSSVKINVDLFKKSPDTVPASSLPAQVVEVTDITDTTGTDAAGQRDGDALRDDQQPINNQRRTQQPRRSSQRLATLNHRTAIT